MSEISLTNHSYFVQLVWVIVLSLRGKLVVILQDLIVLNNYYLIAQRVYKCKSSQKQVNIFTC